MLLTSGPTSPHCCRFYHRSWQTWVGKKEHRSILSFILAGSQDGGIRWSTRRQPPYPSDQSRGLCSPLHRQASVSPVCRSCANIVHSLNNILRYGGSGSVNFYMAHGGTNFGVWAGCNGNEFDISSYDYGAPISEAGQTGQPGVGGPNKFKVAPVSVCT